MAAATSASPSTPASARRTKLTGRAFYESLGSPKMILAPMVDQSEFAWRLLTRSFMSPESSKDLLAYTPMFHARLFRETTKFRDHHFQPTRRGLVSQELPISHDKSSDVFLDGHPGIDRPLFVQFCANEPKDFLEAAKYVQHYCDAVDLNLGCPQGIAKKGSYGAFLQEDWDRIYSLIRTLHENLDIPVTAKMRILETKEKTLKYAETILSAGASILTIHGRQRDQKGHKTGLADWSVIRYLREKLPPETVLFANGNVLRYGDLQECLDQTGADGVMSAEGNLCDPSIFAPPPPFDPLGREYFYSHDGKRNGYRMDAVFRRYMDIIYRNVLEKPPPPRKPLFIVSDLQLVQASTQGNTSKEVLANDITSHEPPHKKQKRDVAPAPRKPSGQKPTSPNLLAMQAHLFHLLRPLVAKHTEVRDALARSRAGDMADFENVLTLTEEATKEGLLDYEAHPESYVYDVLAEEKGTSGERKSEGDFDHESSLATVQACKRPWWVCQPYVRPLPKEALEKGSIALSKKEKRRLEIEAKEKKPASRDAIQGEGELGQGFKVSEREKLDAKDGLKNGDVAGEALVCG